MVTSIHSCNTVKKNVPLKFRAYGVKVIFWKSHLPHPGLERNYHFLYSRSYMLMIDCMLLNQIKFKIFTLCKKNSN